jgi:hypothetical protein
MKIKTLINRIKRLYDENQFIDEIQSEREQSFHYEINRFEMLFNVQCTNSPFPDKGCYEQHGNVKYCSHYIKGFFDITLMRKILCPHFSPVHRTLAKCKRCGKEVRLPDRCLWSEGWCDKCFHDPNNADALKIRQEAANFSAMLCYFDR